MKIRAKDFEKISIRGCVAYGICCLENAMEHYGIKGEGWNYLLKKLWWYTELSAATDPSINNCLPLERWWALICGIPPHTIQLRDSYTDFLAHFKPHYPNNTPTKEEFELLKDGYLKYNNIISLIDSIYMDIYDIGTNELWAGIQEISLATLRPLQNLIKIMYKKKIPLPSIEPFRQYVFDKEGWDYDLHGFGEMFDGTQYSKFVNSTK